MRDLIGEARFNNVLPPFTDMWILARCKYKSGEHRYGGFAGGFLERARALLGVSINDPVLHVCGGLVRHYPYKGGFGNFDKLVDLDPALEPDYLCDVRDLSEFRNWPAILCDPPYTEEDAEKYPPGAEVFPTPNLLLKNCLQAVRPGGRVGMLHLVIPSPPNPEVVGFETKFIAVVGVMVGYNNKIRAYTVFERLID